MITNEDIKAIISKELESFSDKSNVYGFNLNECLIDPVKQTYISSVDDNIKLTLWTVLEESEDKTGYKITFDADDLTFGLGILTESNELMDIGTYGTFLETLRSM